MLDELPKLDPLSDDLLNDELPELDELSDMEDESLTELESDDDKLFDDSDTLTRLPDESERLDDSLELPELDELLDDELLSLTDELDLEEPLCQLALIRPLLDMRIEYAARWQQTACSCGLGIAYS